MLARDPQLLTALCLGLAWLAACNDGGGTPELGPLAEAGFDLGSADRPGRDQLAADQPGSNSDQRRLDGSAALPGSCSGSCATQTLQATFGTTVEPFERAVYGIDKNAQGKLGIYLEALHGGFTGCPTQSSPTPDRTLIVSGLPLPLDGKPVSKAEGLSVTLLDFKGTLLKSSTVSKANAATASYQAASICASCLGQPPPSHPAGYVALELTASFAEGTISGHLYAVHCDSLE